MNIYRISQTDRKGYDTFDAAVVAADSEDAARRIHPVQSWRSGDSDCDWQDGSNNEDWVEPYHGWASHPDKVSVELLGAALNGVKQGVIVASYNAG